MGMPTHTLLIHTDEVYQNPSDLFLHFHYKNTHTQTQKYQKTKDSNQKKNNLLCEQLAPDQSLNSDPATLSQDL